jgi:chromate transport protein ChrA
VSKNSVLFTATVLVSLAVMLLSFTLCYRQFYKLPLVKAFLYGVLVLACTYVVQMVITTVVFVVYAILRG